MSGDQYQYSQCLLFVVQKGDRSEVGKSQGSSGSCASAVPSTPTAFAVFSEAFEKKRPEVVGRFRENGLDMLSLQNVSCFLLREDAKVELIELFLEECPSASLHPLTIITDCSNKQIIRLLLSNTTVLVEYNDCKNVRPAVDETNFEVVKHLFMHKSDIYFRLSRGESLLHLAAKYGPESLLSLILERGGDIEVRTRYKETALYLSARYGFVGGVELLLMKGANIEAQTDRGDTPLHEAARGGHVRVITVLLDRGADIEAAQPWDEDTPLLVAAKNCHEAAVLVLIERGADVQARDKFGKTGLHIAARRGSVSIVELFLRHGAIVDAKDGNGKTALHFATYEGDSDVVETLLLNNADVNAKSENGRTPIHCAVGEGHIELVKVLIKFGAQVSVDDNNGESVLHCAYESDKDDHSIFHYLLENCFLLPGSLKEISDLAMELKQLRDNPYFRKQCTFRDFSRIFAHHIVKICALQSINEFGDLDPSPFWTDSATTIVDFKVSCAEEVARLKLTSVADTNVSYCDFLAYDVPKAAAFLRNDSVAEITESALKEMFPIFGSILSHHFDKGRELKSMIAQSIKICEALFGTPYKELPSELQDRILVDFNYKDLSSLIKAWQRSIESSTADSGN